MIYTRNKQSFKTKTVKAAYSGTSSNKLSENGLSLVEELRQRLQNKNKKPSHISSEVSNGHSVSDRPKSSTPKKLTISKNFGNNQQQNFKETLDNEESTHEDKIKELGLNLNLNAHANKNTAVAKSSHGQSPLSGSNNPFSKIKKDSFIELINHHNPNHPSSHITQFENPKKQDDKRYMSGQHQHFYDQVKQSCESPIQGLNKSNYSNKSSSIEAQTTITSKQVYENQVKKWGNRARENSIGVKENPTQVIEQGNFHSLKTELRQQGQQSHEGNKIITKPKRATALSIVSKTINQPIISHTPSQTSIPSAQQQYLQLLQSQISALRQQLSENTSQINNLTFSNSKLSSSNELLAEENIHLKSNLQRIEQQLLQSSENSFVIEKYERLFEKMRNLLIINAMEMIQTKNFIQLNLTSSSLNASLNNSPQKSFKHSYLETSNKHHPKPKNQPFIDQSDSYSRISSINECLAKIQQTIQVSQAIVNINRQRDLQNIGKNTFNGMLQVKELNQTINYKDKIILKLKEEITQMKDKFSMTKSGTNTSFIKQDQTLQTDKPYSYVDEIHLLRHEINRLTQQNCVFYDKYSQIKAQINEKQRHEKTKNFPNQHRIIQIESLMKKLDKHQMDQMNNSKLQYWTNNKTNNRKLQTSQTSRNNKIGQQKIIHRSKERYSLERKGQKVQYSGQDFSELVREFKSSLSGLTPEKKQILTQDHHIKSNHNSGQKKHFDHFSQEDQVIELPTFRTPKQANSQSKKQNSVNGSAIRTQIKSSSGELIQQDQDNEAGYIEAISRLQYEKEFLASQRESLLKDNEKLIQRVKELQNTHQNDNMSLVLKEQNYKLNFQNQQLVNRIVEAQNRLISYQNKPLKSQQHPSSLNELKKSLQLRENEIQSLMKQNIQLHKTIQTLEANNQILTKTLQSAKNYPSSQNHTEQQQLSYILAPSFEQLFTFLKKLPSEKQHYHQILLNMIEGYERKVSQLRQENVTLKSRHKELQDLFFDFKDTFEKVSKYLTSQKNLNNNGKGFELANDHNVTKLSGEIQKSLIKLEEINETYFTRVISPIVTKSTTHSSHSSHSHTIISLQSRINYHLMFLRSLVQGIGQSDLELIESQLSDYLKQLRTRIPTVLQREEYEESNQSSLNTSVVQEEDGEN